MDSIIEKRLVTPVISGGITYHDYAVDSLLGDIYSRRQSGEWKRLSPSATEDGAPSGQYPFVVLFGDLTDDIKQYLDLAGCTYKVGYRKNTFSRKARVHRIVQETLNPILPCPPDVPAEDWANTPESVKKCTLIRMGWQVNHIDHDKTNYKPYNLEWVTINQNIQAYRRHYGHSN